MATKQPNVPAWLVAILIALGVIGVRNENSQYAKGRVGLWLPSATTGLPTGNPVLTAAETDMSTTGYKAQTFTLVPSFLGQLWVGYASSSASGT